MSCWWPVLISGIPAFYRLGRSVHVGSRPPVTSLSANRSSPAPSRDFMSQRTPLKVVFGIKNALCISLHIHQHGWGPIRQDGFMGATDGLPQFAQSPCVLMKRATAIPRF